MFQLHPEGWNVADHLLTGLANIGFWPPPGTRVLHLGCGSGDVVYRLRELGFEAFGFDLDDHVLYRRPDDRRYFRFGGSSSSRDRVQTGYNDGAFDLAVSISHLENVSDLDFLMAEIARVLAPEGVAVHLYAAAEARAGALAWWHALRKLIGRDGPQVTQTAASSTAPPVRRYTREELRAICSPYFNHVRFEDERFYMNFEAAKLIRRERGSGPAALPRRARSSVETGVLCTDGSRVSLRLPMPHPSDAYESWKSTRVVLVPPFEHQTGHAYTAALPELEKLCDSPEFPTRSPYLLFEDGRLIGQPHIPHAEIIRFGNGRHSHWGDQLYFSCSDQTDPNANGREYTIARPLED